MSEIPPRIINKEITWKDAAGIDRSAIIDGDLGVHGGTAYLFTAISPDKENKLLIKFPKPNETVENELWVLQTLRANNAEKFIPEFAGTILEGVKVIVMEFLPHERQWGRLLDNNEFDKHSIVRAGLQAIDLFEICHKEWIVNTDTKLENFFWMKPDRFVLIDWNTYLTYSKKMDSDKKKEFDEAKLGNYFTLFKYLYEMYTGRSVTNPIPPLRSREPKDWKECPFLLKRTLIDLQRSEGVPVDELRLRLKKLGELIILVEKQEWDVLVQLAEKEVSGKKITLNLANDMEDVLSMLPANIPVNYKEKIDTLRQRAKDAVADASEVLVATETEIVIRIKELRFSMAINIAQEAIDKIQLTLDKKWNLAKLLIIADLFNKLSTESVNVTLEDVQTIVDSLPQLKLNKKLSNEKADGIFGEAFSVIINSEGWIKKLDQLFDLDQQEQLKTQKNFQEWWQNVEINQLFPEKARLIYKAMLPNFDINQVERQVNIRLNRAKKENEMDKFLNEFSDLLETNKEYPTEKIDELLTRESGMLAEETTFQIVDKVHNGIKKDNWEDVLQTIHDKKNGLKTTTRQLIISKIPNLLSLWLTGWNEKIISSGDQQHLKRVEKLALKILPSFHLSDELIERLKGFESLDKHNRNYLERCQQLQIEPWLIDQEDKNVTVDKLIKVLDLKDFQKDIDDSKKQLEENAKQAESISSEITEQQEIIQKLNEQFEKNQKLINKTRENVELLISGLSERVNEAIGSLNKIADTNLQMISLRWWKYLKDGEILKIEDELRQMKSSENELVINFISEWKLKLKQVRDLKELLAGSRKDGEYKQLIALCHLIYADIIWESAQALIKKEKGIGISVDLQPSKKKRLIKFKEKIKQIKWFGHKEK